ncbi:hypothetical protein N2601_29695 (plasmid) [Rhizobium sp. CB3060]|uniref:hypothetical protein n=1 Tax=Rhizobium sp. CB3060 TaxID=3138255 RepID=UPI0021A8E936|nr:hypothetical protein [Rhizobium tropici]UWU25630.1 hypothetical protein N2601_29695 [Rhizobium tropici]
MTTYSLSLSFLEAVPLQALGDDRRDVTILADIEGYRASLSETGASNAGVGYDLIPVSIDGSGVFHPKVTLLSSHQDELRALVGSGNLTMGGWGFNTEVAEYLNPESDPDAFTDLADFLLCLGDASGQGRVQLDPSALPPLQQFADLCLSASDGKSGGPTRVLHSVNRALAPQIVELAKNLGGARTLTVLSPYFGGPKAVLDLARDLHCQKVNVFVPPKVPFWFDFDGAKSAGLHAQPVISDLFSGDRLLHAKAFDIECTRGRLTISGSANATINGLGLGSVEVVVARVSDGPPWLGWADSGYPKGLVGEGGQEPGHTTSPCLIARLDGSGVIGHVLDVVNPAGLWNASLYAPGRFETIGPVELTADGRFNIERRKVDAAVSSLQLVLARENETVRGWLVMTEIIAAVRERGAVAEAMARAAGGAENPRDNDIIAGFFTKHPEAFLGGEEPTTSVGTSAKPGGQEETSRLVPAGELALGDALKPENDRSAGGAGQSAFQKLIARFRQRITDAGPRQGQGHGHENDAADGGDDGREESVWSNAEILAGAIRSFMRKIDESPDGQTKRENILSVLDFILYGADNVEEPEQFLKTHLPAWRNLAKRAGPPRSGLDVLDRCYVVATVAPGIRSPEKSSETHKALEIWFRGGLTRQHRNLLEKPPTGYRESQICPDVNSWEWTLGVTGLLAAETSWQRNRNLIAALNGNGPMPDLSRVATRVEIDTFEKIRNRRKQRETVSLRRDWKHCPACNMKLAAVEIGRLRKGGIASCQGLRCSAIIVDVEPEDFQ